MSQTLGSSPPPTRRRWRGPLVGLVVILLVACAGVLYGFRGSDKEAGSAACPGAAALAARLDPLVHGDVAALTLAKSPRPMPALSFKGDEGTSKSLDDFKGKTVLLNLWATWCVPCRKEMPALDRLQAALGGPDFQVVAVNVDTAKLDRPKQFLNDVAVKALPFYADPTGKIFQTLREAGPVLGLPTTFLIDHNGCAVGIMTGPAEWSSTDAEKVIAAAKS